MKIVKQREIPKIIPIFEAIKYRIPESDKRYQEIKSQYLKEKAGYHGERELDYFLNMIASNDYFNFQGIRLRLSEKYFQMDSLVISPNFILISEVKNWAGIIKFDSVTKQVIQDNNGNIIKRQDPTLQAHRHKLQLQEWFKRNNLKCPPIETLAVIASQDTLLDFDIQNETTEKIIYPEYVIEKITQFQTKYQTPVLNKKEMHAISKQILEKHTPKEVDILKTFNISPKDLTSGVQCPQCKMIPMIRKYRTWFCPSCKIHSSTAHEKAILDYLLFYPSITNKQCREFLGLPPSSVKIVSQFLNKMELPSTGTTYNRVYFRSNELLNLYKGKDLIPKGKGHNPK